MIKFRAMYFDGRTSRPLAATCACHRTKLRISGSDGILLCEVPLNDCRIDPPLGRTLRTVRLPGGAVCETSDGNAVAAIERMTASNRGLRLVNFLEARWRTVLLSLCGVIISVWLFHAYAIPALAKKAAFSIPREVSEVVSSQTLKVIDERFLKPSALDAARVDTLRKAFDRLVAETGAADFAYRLEFRKSPLVGPNAFALPSGLIVMTDELVALSETDEELKAVLLHELAHVRQRHALRMVIQDAGIFLVLTALTGDVSGISTAAASLPVILAQTGYSRDFEKEADSYAIVHLVGSGAGVKPFQDIIRRLGKIRPDLPGESVLSTHPMTGERIEYMSAIANNISKKK